MNIYVARRLIQNLRRENFRLLLYRRETTSVIKSDNKIEEQWEKKMKFYMKTYEDLFGITKLTEMHDRVQEIQRNLQTVQENRRKVQEEIFIVQKKLQEMQDILHKTSMGDDMYISVVTQVRELLKEQKRLQDIFSLYDQTEREQQTTLALAINNSQDHERTYREKNKYLSLITGIVGGVLGIVGSSINNWRHRKDIKHFASDISDQVIDLKKSVKKLESAVLAEGTLRSVSSDQSEEAENLLTLVKTQNSKLDDSIQSLQSLLSGGAVSKSTDGTSYSAEDKNIENIEEILFKFEENIQSKLKDHAYVNVGLIGTYTLLFTFFVLYIMRTS